MRRNASPRGKAIDGRWRGSQTSLFPRSRRYSVDKGQLEDSLRWRGRQRGGILFIVARVVWARQCVVECWKTPTQRQHATLTSTAAQRSSQTSHARELSATAALIFAQLSLCSRARWSPYREDFSAGHRKLLPFPRRLARCVMPSAEPRWLPSKRKIAHSQAWHCDFPKVCKFPCRLSYVVLMLSVMACDLDLPPQVACHSSTLIDVLYLILALCLAAPSCSLFASVPTKDTLPY